MDEINIDFDIHTRCQDFMMTNDFRGNNVVYKFALDSFTASKYRLWCFIVNVHYKLLFVKLIKNTEKPQISRISRCLGVNLSAMDRGLCDSSPESSKG